MADLSFQGYVYSWRPSTLFSIPRTEEESIYFGIRSAMMTGPTFYKLVTGYRTVTAANIALHGSRFAAAGYAATNNWTAYKLMKELRWAANPYVFVGGTALAAQHHTLTSPAPTEAMRSEPGETSWWRSVAQAMTGGFGIGSADVLR